MCESDPRGWIRVECRGYRQEAYRRPLRWTPAFEGHAAVEGDSAAGASQDLGDLGLAAAVGAEDIGPECLLGVVVHSELHRDEGRLARKNIASESLPRSFLDHGLQVGTVGGEQAALIGMGALAEPGGVAAAAHVAEGQFPIGMPGQGVRLDVGGVEALFGDAVAEEDDPVAVTDGELRGKTSERREACGGSDQRAEKGQGSSLGLKRPVIQGCRCR